MFLQVKEKVMAYLFLSLDNNAARFYRYPSQKNLQFDERSWNLKILIRWIMCSLLLEIHIIKKHA